MEREELDRFLQQYTPTEEWCLKNGSVELPPSSVCWSRRHGESYLIEGGQYMEPGEKIVVVRQERFCPVPPHNHDYIELCYVWSGTCYQTIEGREAVTESGDVCIFDTNAVHSVRAAGKNDILVNLLMRKEFFDTGFLSRMTRQGIVSKFLVDAVSESRRKRHYLHFHAHKNHRIRELMESILLEYYTKDIGMEEALESYVNVLLTELLRSMRDESREKCAEPEKVQVLELLSYIEQNYIHCTLNDMGRAFGMSGNYLTALLKEKTGRSFVEHVQEQRLKQARMLLENTDLPLAELIPLCGYNNMNFFYKKFRESFGCTPAQYRKSKRISETP